MSYHVEIAYPWNYKRRERAYVRHVLCPTLVSLGYYRVNTAGAVTGRCTDGCRQRASDNGCDRLFVRPSPPNKVSRRCATDGVVAPQILFRHRPAGRHTPVISHPAHSPPSFNPLTHARSNLCCRLHTNGLGLTQRNLICNPF